MYMKELSLLSCHSSGGVTTVPLSPPLKTGTCLHFLSSRPHTLAGTVCKDVLEKLSVSSGPAHSTELGEH